MNKSKEIANELLNASRGLFYRKAVALRKFYEMVELPEFSGKPLYPSGVMQTVNYMNNMTVDLSDLEEQTRNEIASVFFKDYSSVPYEHAVGGNMYTHSIPHYERVLKEGFFSYYERIKKIVDEDLRDGLKVLLEGIRIFAERCVSYLISVNADEKLITALKKVPMYPAEDIYEAVVCWNFVLYLDGCDNLGCIADGLMPYYEGENIVPILANMFENLDLNNGYSMALSRLYNPLTIQCLEAAKGRRRPMIELFVDKDTPDEIWGKAFSLVRGETGQPAFYNPSLIRRLKDKFNVRDDDINRFCGGGCTESMFSGFSNVGSLDAGINLLLIFEKCLKNNLEKSVDFNEFYNLYISDVNETVNWITKEIACSQRRRAEYNPLPMRTLLVDDCIENGLDFNNGGARYQWSIINFAGLINVIDSLLAVRDLVFEEKKYTKKEFLTKLALEEDSFVKKLRNHSNCYGIDDEAVNAFSNKLSSDVFSMLEGKKAYFGQGFIPASIQFMSQVEAGKKIGPTPDGRKKGMPLCDSLGAIFAKDTKGPTALLKSVTSLDLKKALGVPVLNFNINPDFNDEILKSLIISYMELGGTQMQITCVNKEMLEEAFKNPDLYKNLVVRVGGYSEYFSRLSDELKRMIINRTIQKKV
ncbi:MAG: pyruvate formate lyase family protein [Acutalibacteraceae bacterium]|nr:pyruvate formate lyase family protein [Acutalibacteraceae bacterium]